MSPVALFFSLIFAVAGAVAYCLGWTCDLYGNCTAWQMSVAAAAIMFLAYLVVDRLEAQFKKTKRPLGGTRAERLILVAASRKLVIPNKWRAAETHPSRAGVTRGPLMLPSPRSSRNAEL
jgi:hypothetical protein